MRQLPKNDPKKNTYHIFCAEERVLVGNKVNDNAERQPDIGERKPGENQRRDVILEFRGRDEPVYHLTDKQVTYDALNMEENHADNAVTGLIQAEEMNKRVLPQAISEGENRTT